MMPYEDIQFQLVDLPPIANERTHGWVSGIVRVADALLIVIDLAEDADIQMDRFSMEKWDIWDRRSRKKANTVLPGQTRPCRCK